MVVSAALAFSAAAQDAVKSSLSAPAAGSLVGDEDHHLTDIAPAEGFLMGYVEATSAQPEIASPWRYSSGARPIWHTLGESGGTEVSAEPRRFAYELHLNIRGVYDDNIDISHSDRISDFYTAIEPSITVGFGDLSGHETNYLRLIYSPSVLIFADHSEANAVEHLIDLKGQHRFGRLTMSLSEVIAILDGTHIRTLDNISTPGSTVNLDVGGRTRQNLFDTRLDASYDLTGKTFLTAGFNANVTDYPNENLISSQVYSGNLFVNYRYSDKLTIGLGGSGGYDSVDDPNPDQTFEQGNVRLSYELTGKLTFNGSGGVEFRQFENNTRGTFVSPVFDLGLNYQPFDSTTFNLSGSRHINNSGALAGQNYTNTTITLRLEQRFFQRLFVGLAAGYENSDYFSTVNGVTANRRDDYFFIEPSVDLNVTRFWTVGAYYLHRENDSSLASVDFYDNQVGLRTTVTF